MDSEPLPVFDGHNDMLLRLAGGGVFFERDSTGHVDLVRAREGGLAGGFCAIYTRSPGQREGVWPPPHPPPTPSFEEASRVTLAGIARLSRLERESNGALSIVRTAAQIEDCIQAGRFASLMHIEGAEAIDEEFEALEVYHRAGLRSLGPVWSRPNAFGHGVPFDFPGSPDSGAGLTPAGQELVRACNRLRIVVDLSHLTEAGFWDVAAITDAPLVATHSNAHALTPSPRNLTDHQLAAIRDSGGMVGVNFAVTFLRADGAGVADTPLTDVVRHIDYLVARVGIDGVGFGSDFDGAMIPAGIGDASGLPRLLDALRHAGYDEPALRKLAHGNWVRVLRATWGE